MKLVGLVMALSLLGCDGEGSDIACDGMVTHAISDGAMTVSILGDFSEGQPILEIKRPDGSHMNYPATEYDDMTATFTDIPSGMHEVNWILSCFDAGGQAVVSGPTSITVM
jgi:hypothetical protein